MTEPIPAPDPPDLAVESFLALLGARRSARTVDAYRRDLADLRAFLGRSPAEANGDDVQGWLDYKATHELRALPYAARVVYRSGNAAAERKDHETAVRLWRGAEALLETLGIGVVDTPLNRNEAAIRKGFGICRQA